MHEVTIEQKNSNLVLKWQLSKIEIPLAAITEMTSDDTYGGAERTAVRVGFPSATADRILIKTSGQSYLIYSNAGSVIEN
ncbi:hypothetical protein [Metabacillus sp. 84]